MARGVGARRTSSPRRSTSAAGRRQIDTLDIGGGLPVNFASDAPEPDLRAVRAAAGADVPGLFDGRYGLVTEFGRSLLAKHGTVLLARVEYAKTAGGRADRGDPRGRAGGDPHGVRAGDVAAADRRVRRARGAPRPGPRSCRTSRVPPASRVTCWPRGARCRCSNRATTRRRWTRGRTTSRTTTRTTRLPRPGIYGFGPDGAGGVRFATVRTPQTLEEIVAESGGSHAGSLSEL